MMGGPHPTAHPLSTTTDHSPALPPFLSTFPSTSASAPLSSFLSPFPPSLLSAFSPPLSEHSRRRIVNKVTGVKLISGDLSEAWSEGNAEYATVAMNFELTDSMGERASGRTVEGGPAGEATEFWPFMRSRGGPSPLSAIHPA